MKGVSFYNRDPEGPRLTKEVELKFRYGNYDYFYLEYTNGQRIKVARPVIEK
ncbi:MAG: hypothetical protein ACM3X9_01635 [Bacillota bacterium]